MKQKLKTVIKKYTDLSMPNQMREFKTVCMSKKKWKVSDTITILIFFNQYFRYLNPIIV